MTVDAQRVRILKAGEPGSGPVIYWMSRDQRAHDNWALLYAFEQAKAMKRDCVVVFCRVAKFLGAQNRQFEFMDRGLEEVRQILSKKDISFVELKGEPGDEIAAFANKKKAAVLVTDFDPLKIKKRWKKAAMKVVACEMVEVDAHNIVPCWAASDHQEFGAYTIRPKIHKLLPKFLTDMPKVFPGKTEGMKKLEEFIEERLTGYAERRNDPVADAQSGLSPYLHFGQISAQRVAWEVKRSKAPMQDREAFLEELIVRRELSDNFCEYNPHYDSVEGFPDWAKKSHAMHRKDKREYLYTLKEFEHGKTHDDLWNAAQLQMVKSGKMHGYMRMYWAKKILEWTKSPEEAMEIAIELNDKYELDGRDPNGYAGVAWSIGGVHDRAWVSRPVFGQVRYMNRNGCERKFDVEAYIQAWLGKGQGSLI